MVNEQIRFNFDGILAVIFAFLLSVNDTKATESTLEFAITDCMVIYLRIPLVFGWKMVKMVKNDQNEEKIVKKMEKLEKMQNWNLG